MLKTIKFCVDGVVGSLKFVAWIFRELWVFGRWVAGESWKLVKWVLNKIRPD